MSCWAHLLFIVRWLFSHLAILNPYGVHFPNRFHHWNQHDKTIPMVTLLHYFLYVIFYPFFETLIVASAMRATSAAIWSVHTFYMSHSLLSYCKGFLIFPPFIHPARKPTSVPPLTISSDHHKCSLIEHFLLAWPFQIQSLLICFQTP